MTADSVSQGVKSIEVGARLLTALGEAQGALPLGELASRAGMASSKAHRYLVSLIRGDLVLQDPVTGRYDLGPGALQLGLASLRRLDAVRIATDAMIELNQRLDATTALSVWGQNGPVVISWRDASEVVHCNLHIGSVLPLIGVATGRIFLAYLPWKMVEAMVAEEFERLKGSPLGDRYGDVHAVQELIGQVRHDRWAISRGDYLPGLSAVAAPVFDHQGELVASTAILGRTGTMDDDGPDSQAAALLKASDEISRKLGHSPGVDW